MEPLHVIARLASPLAVPLDRVGKPAWPIMFDALLISAATGGDGAEREWESGEPPWVEVPLGEFRVLCAGGEEVRIPRASAGFPSGRMAVAETAAAKRWRSHLDDVVDLERSKGAATGIVGGKRQVGRGPLRDELARLAVVAVEEMHFFAFGDLEGVRDLVLEITHLGPMRTMGYGQVDAWSVRPVGRDESVVDPEGRPARPVPVAAGPWLAEHLGFRPAGVPGVGAAALPPYWAGRERLVYLPPLERWCPWMAGLVEWGRIAREGGEGEPREARRRGE